MARYGDLDALAVKWMLASPEQRKVFRQIIDDIPTADVVPKSEVEKLQQLLDLNCENCICLARKMLDEETVREIEILRVRHLKRIDEAKQEVAREIFEEIEEIIKEPHTVGFCLTSPLKQALNEYNEGIRKEKLYYINKLKKKYTAQNTNNFDSRQTIEENKKKYTESEGKE